MSTNFWACARLYAHAIWALLIAVFFAFGLERTNTMFVVAFAGLAIMYAISETESKQQRRRLKRRADGK